jgi:1-deoxy-D-xylulose-5-phosphate synthase
MLKIGLTQLDGPVSIRYPRGSEGAYTDDFSHLSAVKLTDGPDITMVTYGSMINPVMQAARMLEEEGIHAEVIKLNKITPLDAALIAESAAKTGRILVAEDVISMGCVGERILAQLMQRGISLRGVALCNCGDTFVTHGTIPQLQRLCGMDEKSIVQRVKGVLKRG